MKAYNMMRKYLLLFFSRYFLIIFGLYTVCQGQNYGRGLPDSIKTPIYDLILRPTAYNGKNILTTGYISTGFETSYLTPNKDLLEIYDPTLKIHYTFNAKFKESLTQAIIEKLDGSYILLEGKVELPHAIDEQYPGRNYIRIDIFRITVLKYADKEESNTGTP